MTDDWQVVEEALHDANEDIYWPQGNQDSLAALARLREREAQRENALGLESMRCEKAEARVEYMEGQLFDARRLMDERDARVARLEEALRRTAHELAQWVFADGTASYRVERAEAIIAAALAHEEEA